MGPRLRDIAVFDVACARNYFWLRCTTLPVEGPDFVRQFIPVHNWHAYVSDYEAVDV